MSDDPQKDEADLAAAAKRFMDACPEAASVETFHHARGTGFVIKWSLPGVGFGEFTVWRSAETGAWQVDDEATGAETAARIFAIAFPEGATTALDYQNAGCAQTVAQLTKVFDEIDRTGTWQGRFGSEGMNALVERYQKVAGCLRDAHENDAANRGL